MNSDPDIDPIIFNGVLVQVQVKIHPGSHWVGSMFYNINHIKYSNINNNTVIYTHTYEDKSSHTSWVMRLLLWPHTPWISLWNCLKSHYRHSDMCMLDIMCRKQNFTLPRINPIVHITAMEVKSDRLLWRCARVTLRGFTTLKIGTTHAKNLCQALATKTGKKGSLSLT